MSATATINPPTPPILPATPPVASPSPPARYYLQQSAFRKFTLDEYHKMIETGVLISGEPYELLEGNSGTKNVTRLAPRLGYPGTL